MKLKLTEEQKENGINVLSLFDGISCGYVALKRAGIKVNEYYASEIDKYAISISKFNHPDIKHIGSVTDIKASDLPKIDLIMGGSPCQDLSVAKKNREGLKGKRSGLFFEMIRLIEECKPPLVFLENVASMKNEDRDIITEVLGRAIYREEDGWEAIDEDGNVIQEEDFICNCGEKE